MDGVISRRAFIGTTLGTAGALAIATDVLASTTLPADSAAVTFFDHRFEHAREIATKLAAGGRLEAVNGDPSDFATWMQSQSLKASRPRIQGVTAESVLFCVRQLNPRKQISITRIDRDLFVWSV